MATSGNVEKRPPVFTTIDQLRPDTSGHNLVVKVMAPRSPDGAFTLFGTLLRFGWSSLGRLQPFVSPHQLRFRDLLKNACTLLGRDIMHENANFRLGAPDGSSSSNRQFWSNRTIFNTWMLETPPPVLLMCTPQRHTDGYSRGY